MKQRGGAFNNLMRGNRIGLFYSCVILLFLIVPASSVSATDTMFRANSLHNGVFDGGGMVPINTEQWRFSTGGGVWSSPAVVNGVVYIGSDDKNLYAVDAVTGKEQWRFSTGGGVWSSPAVVNGVVYIGSDDKNLYAVDAVTGKEQWRFSTGGGVWSSPAVVNGVVYIGSDDKNLYAVDAVTGKEQWRFSTGGRVWSSPAVVNGVVYVGSDDKNLYAVDAGTGRELWQFKSRSYIHSSPAVSNGIVSVGSEDENLYAIDAVTGKERWRFSTGGSVDSSPAVLNDLVYIGSRDTNLYAIDTVTGEERWRFKTENYVDSSPIVSNGSIYFGSLDGGLYALDAETGTEEWRFMTSSGIYSSPSVSKGVVYVGNWDHNVYAIGQTLQTPGLATPLIQVPAPSSVSTPAPQDPVSTTALIRFIPILIVLLICSGAVYGFHRFRRNLDREQPSSPNEPVTTKPPVSILSSSDHLEYVSKKASDLKIFQKSASDILSEIRIQFKNGNYQNTEEILEKADSAITLLNQCEYKISVWKAEGFDTLPVENLGTEKIEKILSGIEEYDYEVGILKKINHQVQDLINTRASFLTNPEVQNAILKLEKNSRSPSKVTESDKILSELNTTIDTLQKLQSCDELLKEWTREGYLIPLQKDLQLQPADDILSTVNQLGQRIKTLRQIYDQISLLQKTEPVLLASPQLQAAVEKIRQDLNDPSRADDLEKQFQDLNRNLFQYKLIHQKKCQMLTESIEKIQRYPEICVGDEVWMDTIRECIAVQDCERGEVTFKAWIQEKISRLAQVFEQAPQQNININKVTDSINQMIETGGYVDALIAIEAKRAELAKTKEYFKEALPLKDTVTSPKLMDLFNRGSYEEFIDQVQITRELLSRWNDTLKAAEKVGVVPLTITALSSTPDPESLSRAFRELEDFLKNARPVLEVSLTTTQFTARKMV